MAFAVFDFGDLDEQEDAEERKLEEERQKRRLEAERQELARRREEEKQERLRQHQESILAAELRAVRAEAAQAGLKQAGLNGDWAWDPGALKAAVGSLLKWQQYGMQALTTEASQLKVPLHGVPCGFPVSHLERKMTIERMWVGNIWNQMPSDLLKYECLRREIAFLKHDSHQELVRRLSEDVYGPSNGGSADVRKELHGVPWTGPLANEQGKYVEVKKENAKGKSKGLEFHGKRWTSAPASEQKHKVDNHGPRVRSFLHSFPKFSGKPPGPEAEKWSLSDLQAYFMSNASNAETKPAGLDAEEKQDYSDNTAEVNSEAYGPRIKSFLKDFPEFTGEVPGADAEENWSHFDMRMYFMSNGKTKPPGWNASEPARRKSQDKEFEKQQEAARARQEADKREAVRQRLLKEKLREEQRAREAEFTRQEADRLQKEKLREEQKRRTQEKRELEMRLMKVAVHLRTLGLEPTASAEDVRRVYRKLALQHHPDKQHCAAQDASTFRKISEAYQAIQLQLKP